MVNAPAFVLPTAILAFDIIMVPATYKSIQESSALEVQSGDRFQARWVGEANGR